MDIPQIYGGADSDQYNILHKAIKDAAIEEQQNMEDWAVYKFLHTTPLTSLVAHIVDQLHELGYEIRKR